MSQFKYKMDICWEETKMTTKEYGFYVYLNEGKSMNRNQPMRKAKHLLI